VTDIVRHAKQILRDAGYVVIPRERHVVLTQQWVMPPEYTVENPEQFVEYKLRTMASAIGRHALEAGLCITEDKTLLDPITGRKRFLSVDAGFIKPRDE
jgi:hypothetical protein